MGNVETIRRRERMVQSNSADAERKSSVDDADRGADEAKVVGEEADADAVVCVASCFQPSSCGACGMSWGRPWGSGKGNGSCASERKRESESIAESPNAGAAGAVEAVGAGGGGGGGGAGMMVEGAG